jgi:hypothetical protein
MIWKGERKLRWNLILLEIALKIYILKLMVFNLNVVDLIIVITS